MHIFLWTPRMCKYMIGDLARQLFYPCLYLVYRECMGPFLTQGHTVVIKGFSTNSRTKFHRLINNFGQKLIIVNPFLGPHILYCLRSYCAISTIFWGGMAYHKETIWTKWFSTTSVALDLCTVKWNERYWSNSYWDIGFQLKVNGASTLYNDEF